MKNKARTFASQVRHRHFSWGGQVLVSRYPAHGSISIVGSLRGGTRSMGEERARIHASMLLEGTHTHSKEELQRMLDAIGASVSFFPTTDRLCFSARVLSKHTNELLQIIAEVLREPLFPAQELATLKKREESTLSYEAQDSQKQATIMFLRKLFPNTHPNYAATTKESRAVLSSITYTDLMRLHAQMINRQSLIVSIAGDIEYSKAPTLVNTYFKALPNKTLRFPRFSKASRTTSSRARMFIPEKTSIDYLIGLAAGIPKIHKDFVPLQLGISILGNPGFLGRLFRIVREEKGLTYRVYAYASGFSPGIDGYLSVSASFAPSLFSTGRQAIKDELIRIVTQGITDEEVTIHKDLFIYRSEVALSNSEAFALTAHNLAVDGRPMGYLDTLRKQVRALTTKEIQKALQTYLIPQDMVECAAGPVEKNMLGA